MEIRSSLARAAFALLAAACALPAQAALGGDAASVTADQAAWSAALTSTAGNGYTDYELTLPSGVIVHEYLSTASGQVFEVSWNGKGRRPDMQRLLGSWAGRLASSARGARPMQRRADSVGSDMVLHSAVRARHFIGTAHLPPMLPATLSGPIPFNPK